MRGSDTSEPPNPVSVRSVGIVDGSVGLRVLAFLFTHTCSVVVFGWLIGGRPACSQPKLALVTDVFLWLMVIVAL